MLHAYQTTSILLELETYDGHVVLKSILCFEVRQRSQKMLVDIFAPVPLMTNNSSIVLGRHDNHSHKMRNHLASW
jgi:hypothetical protein